MKSARQLLQTISTKKGEPRQGEAKGFLRLPLQGAKAEGPAKSSSSSSSRPHPAERGCCPAPSSTPAEPAPLRPQPCRPAAPAPGRGKAISARNRRRFDPEELPGKGGKCFRALRPREGGEGFPRVRSAGSRVGAARLPSGCFGFLRKGIKTCPPPPHPEAVKYFIRKRGFFLVLAFKSHSASQLGLGKEAPVRQRNKTQVGLIRENPLGGQQPVSPPTPSWR